MTPFISDTFFGIVQRIGDIHDIPGRLLVLNLNQKVHLTYFFNITLIRKADGLKNPEKCLRRPSRQRSSEKVSTEEGLFKRTSKA